MNKAMVQIIPPGSVIGILGGGQLGRMTALAAANLGYKCHIFTPEQDAPASHCVHAVTIADYRDGTALTHFASQVDVVTLEFENVPVEALAALATLVPVRPNPRVLGICQDRIHEKGFANHHGLATVKWTAIDSAQALKSALTAHGGSNVLKTTRLGYDGKGQIKIPAGSMETADDIWAALNTDQAILEQFADLEREISVIVARSIDGQMKCFEPSENDHRNHILDTSTLPARITDAQQQQAMTGAMILAEAMDVVGLLAVELFLTRNGKILFNEMAPRPHNSGHWTQDAAITSQFEQLVRAVCGLPLGNPDRICPVIMHNLIGEDINNWANILAEPGSKLHLYGKSAARAGRKMGHVNRLWPNGLPHEQ